MRRLVVLSSGLAALAALTACGSPHQAGPSVLRVFDPTGQVRTEVTFAGINRQRIGVADNAPQHSALVWLPFTKSGEANFCRLTDALERRGAATHNHHEKFAVELNGHVYESTALYSIDYTYKHPDYCRVGPDGEDVVIGHTNARRVTHRLQVAGILDVKALTPSSTPSVAGGSRTYDPSTVRAAFARQGFRLRHLGWDPGGLPPMHHALPLTYFVSGGGVKIKPDGTVRLNSPGPRFEVVILRSPAAARSAFSQRVNLYLNYLQAPRARASNVDLVALTGDGFGHPGGVWQRALKTLNLLSR